MNGETRLKSTLSWAVAAMLAGLGIVEALEQFGAPPALAAFFPFVPLVICLLVALSMRSLGFVEMIRGGAFSRDATGWAIGGLSASALLLIAAPVATALGGSRGLLLLLCFLAGLALALFLVAPQLKATGAPTLAGAIGERYGRGARILAALAIVAALLPLATAQVAVAGVVGSRMLGIPAADARDIAVCLAALACLVGGTRAAIAMAAIAAPIVAVAYLTPISILSLSAGPLPFPWLGLFEPATYDAPTRLPGTVFVALAVSLVAGIGTLPTLLLPAAARRRRSPGLRSGLIALAVASALILAAPSYSLFGAALGIDATTDPAGLVVNFAERAGLSASPSVLLIGGLLTAALVATTAMFATAAAAIGNDLYVCLLERSAPEGRRIFITRLGAVALAVLALLLCRAAGANAAFLATAGLSIGAASLGPVLLLSWRIRRIGALPAVAALSVGLALTLADIGFAVLFPDAAGRLLGMGSIVPTALGPTGWFGLPVGLAGLPAILFAILTLWGVSEIPRTDWRQTGARIRAAAAGAVGAGASAIAAGRARWKARSMKPASATLTSEPAPPSEAELPDHPTQATEAGVATAEAVSAAPRPAEPVRDAGEPALAAPILPSPPEPAAADIVKG